MDPWVTLVIAGAAIAGYGWLKSEPKEQAPATVNEAAYDRLLEDLETENRELVDAVAAFKREQDETVSRLGRRIRELERQMEAASDRQAAIDRREAAGEEPGSKPVGVPDAASAPVQHASEQTTAPAADSKLPDRAPVQHASFDEVTADRLADVPAAAVTSHDAPQAGQPAYAEAAAEAALDRPTAISERYAALLAMYGRGRSVEQVAKAMNMNKGEVQLILQLAKREVDRP